MMLKKLIELFIKSFNLLKYSIIIPKPKFKVGDRVWSKINGLELTQCTIISSMYCFERKEWGYGAKDYSNEKYQETVHYTYHLANWESAYRLVDPETDIYNRVCSVGYQRKKK